MNFASLKFNDILTQETLETSRIMRRYKKCNHGKLKKKYPFKLRKRIKKMNWME